MKRQELLGRIEARWQALLASCAGLTDAEMLAPGVVENHLTLGATWTLADKSEVTVGYMHAFSKTVSGSGSIPPGAPPGFGGGEANLKMQQNSLGIAYGRKL